MDVSVRERATGWVVARKRGTPEAIKRFAAKYDKSVYAVEEGYQPLHKPPLDMNSVKAQREQLIRRYEWTVAPHSPLTAASQREWMNYLKALHKVTKNVTDPRQVVWPVAPEGFDYEG